MEKIKIMINKQLEVKFRARPTNNTNTRTHKQEVYTQMLSNAHANHINFNEDRTEVFWNEETDGDHYLESGVCDNDFGKNKSRNDAIEGLRDTYSADRKIGNAYYEQQRQSTYRSLEDYRKFLQEIEDRGLCIKAKPVTTYQDKLDILYCDPNDKRGLDPVTKDDPDIYFSFRDLNKFQREEEEDKL